MTNPLNIMDDLYEARNQLVYYKNMEKLLEYYKPELYERIKKELLDSVVAELENHTND